MKALRSEHWTWIGITTPEHFCTEVPTKEYFCKQITVDILNIIYFFNILNTVQKSEILCEDFWFSADVNGLTRKCCEWELLLYAPLGNNPLTHQLIPTYPRFKVSSLTRVAQ